MKTSYRLSMIAAILTALAATAGLFIPGLYQDSEYLITVWQGNDWVTLIVVVPALLITLYLSEQGSIKAWLIWMGLLLYLFYNYAFYLFATAFNAVFLAYVSLFAVSACALIYGLSAFPVQRISFGSKHLFWIAGYLLLIAFNLYDNEFLSSFPTQIFPNGARNNNLTCSGYASRVHCVCL